MQNQEDEELLERFHLMDREERDFFLTSFRACTEGRTKKKPRPKKKHNFKLILGGQSALPDDLRRRGFG